MFPKNRTWVDKTMNKILQDTAKEFGLELGQVVDIFESFWTSVRGAMGSGLFPTLHIPKFGYFRPSKRKFNKKIKWLETQGDEEKKLAKRYKKTLKRIINEQKQRRRKK